MVGRVIYKKTKHLRGNSCLIEVAIVEHSQFDVLEVICFAPANAVEAERLYLRYSAIKDHFDLDNIRTDERNLRGSVLLMSVIKFVEHRLQVVTLDLENNILEVEFQDNLFSFPSLKEQFDYSVKKPSALVPFFVNRWARDNHSKNILLFGVGDRGNFWIQDFTPRAAIVKVRRNSITSDSPFEDSSSHQQDDFTPHSPCRSLSPCPSPRPHVLFSQSYSSSEARKKAKNTEAHLHMGIGATVHHNQPHKRGGSSSRDLACSSVSSFCSQIGPSTASASPFTQRILSRVSRASTALLQGLGVTFSSVYCTRRLKVHAALDEDSGAGLRIYTTHSEPTILVKPVAGVLTGKHSDFTAAVSPHSAYESRQMKATTTDSSRPGHFGARSGSPPAASPKSILFG